jgi:2'-5' RNA ligase
LRAFFAAPVSEGARGEIAAYAENLRGSFRIRRGRGRRSFAEGTPKAGAERSSSRGWVRPENYHITLRFLGEIEKERASELSGKVSAAVCECQTFCISTGSPFLMRSNRSRSVVALELSPLEPLIVLSERVEQCLRSAGMPKESRSFRPHLTLARLRNLRGNPLEEASQSSPTANWPISQIVLYESQLGAGGARYTELDSFPFQPDATPSKDKQGDRYGTK